MQRLILFILSLGASQGMASSQGPIPSKGVGTMLSLEALFEEFSASVRACQDACWRGEPLLLSRAYRALWGLFVRSAGTLESALNRGVDAAPWNRLADVLLAVCFYGDLVHPQSGAAQGLEYTLGQDPDYQKMLKDTPILGSALQILVQAAQECKRFAENGFDLDDASIARAVVQRGSSHSPETIQKILVLCEFSKRWREFDRSSHASPEGELLPEREPDPVFEEPVFSDVDVSPVADEPQPILLGVKELAKASHLFAAKMDQSQEEEPPAALPSAQEIGSLLNEVTPASVLSPVDFADDPLSDSELDFPDDVELLALAALEQLDRSQAAFCRQTRMTRVQEKIKGETVSAR